MKIFLLPGMDGTGILFDPLIQYFPSGVEYDVVCLNDFEDQSYCSQAKQIAEKIGSDQVVLVAESFSGKIAFELCELLKHQISAIIFIASFITVPTALCRIAALLPVGLLNSRYIPSSLLNYICFSGHGNKQIIGLVRKSIELAKPQILKQRIKNMSNLNIPSQTHTMRSIYIRPTQDRLVDYNALDNLGKIYLNLEVINLAGGHFIAQQRPEECAKVIVNAAIT